MGVSDEVGQAAAAGSSVSVGVSSLNCVGQAFAAIKPDLVVSASSHALRGLRFVGSDHIQIVVHDIERAVDGRMRGFTERQAAMLRDAVCGKARSSILVHCKAGLGRAPALAIGALVMLGAKPQDAVRAVAGIAPGASPNRRIVALCLAATGYDSESVQLIREECEGTWSYRRTAYGASGDRLTFGVCNIRIRQVFPGPSGGRVARG